MFNIGPGELMAIAAVALIVLGPQRLPQALRSVGRVVGELRRVSGGFQDELRRAIDDSDVDDDPIGDITEGRPTSTSPAAKSPASSAPTSGTGSAPAKPGPADASGPSALDDDDEPQRMLLPSDLPEPDLDDDAGTEAEPTGNDERHDATAGDSAADADGGERAVS